MSKDSFLHGNWTLTRHIDDRHSNTRMTATGTLTVDNTLWAEQGILDGNKFTQNYGLVFDNKGGLTVNFPDGRLFYTLENQTQPQTIDHRCGNDHYQGEYTVQSQTQFTQIWKVKGPKKEYTMITEYSRSLKFIKK